MDLNASVDVNCGRKTERLVRTLLKQVRQEGTEMGRRIEELFSIPQSNQSLSTGSCIPDMILLS